MQSARCCHLVPVGNRVVILQTEQRGKPAGAISLYRDPFQFLGFFRQRKGWPPGVAPKSLRLSLAASRDGVELKRLPVVCDGLSFVVHRLVGPAQVAIGKG